MSTAHLAVDLQRLAELVDSSPTLALGGPAPQDRDLQAVEALVGRLPESYRWWLLAGGHGRIQGEAIAGVAPPDVEAIDHIGEPWRRGDVLLCFHTDADGVAHCFERNAVEDAENAVIRVDAFGERQRFADSFAGFLTRQDALRRGLGDGPTPEIAALWGLTPGLLREDGLNLYGPHDFAERNATYEVAAYAPGWVMIGDDSGGAGLFVRSHGPDRHSVWRLGMGAICPEVEQIGTHITDRLLPWLASGAELPE